MLSSKSVQFLLNVIRIGMLLRIESRIAFRQKKGRLNPEQEKFFQTFFFKLRNLIKLVINGNLLNRKG